MRKSTIPNDDHYYEPQRTIRPDDCMQIGHGEKKRRKMKDRLCRAVCSGIDLFQDHRDTLCVDQRHAESRGETEGPHRLLFTLYPVHRTVADRKKKKRMTSILVKLEQNDEKFMNAGKDKYNGEEEK